MGTAIERSLYAFAVLLLLVQPCVSALEVKKSPSDELAYESFRLSNGLKVLLVSDPDTDKAAAAMSVRVGSGSDPHDRQGLAHFLEHMLFLGTQKYPQPGEYHEFIRANGGSQNAYTTYDNTTYFFDIDALRLEGALDRFSQFFVAPLFNPTYVERELQAVESEYRARFDNDARRRIEAEKTLLDPAHPYSQFQGGNRESLLAGGEESLRSDMLSFYQQHYSAGLMALAVYGREPLPKLKRWVSERFGDIPDTGAEEMVASVAMYAPGTLPARLDVVPKREHRTVHMVFPIPAVRDLYRSKPLMYIGNLLGHEGPGSLFALLKERGWVDSLSAGGGLSHANEATFSVFMSLTEAGIDHVDDIVDLTFEAVRLIRTEGIQAWSFDEQRKLADLSFRFKQDHEPQDYVVYLATSLHEYPSADVLYGPYAFEAFDPTLIEQFLDALRPDNMLLTVSAQSLEADQQTRWHQTPYASAAIGADLLQRWGDDGGNPELTLPSPNAFVPDSVQLAHSDASAGSTPRIVEEHPGFTVWHQLDSSFEAPRASFFVSLQTETARRDVRATMLTRMYIAVVNDNLNEFSYPATLAGLGYDLYPTAKGMTVRVSGYDDKQPVLLEKIVDALASPEIRADRFEILKDRQLRRLRNTRFNEPYRQARAEVTRLLLEPSWTPAQQIAALEPLTVEALRGFATTLMDEVYVLSLSHGNVEPTDAKRMSELVRSRLASEPRQEPLPESRIVKLAAGSHAVRSMQIEHSDSVVVLYVQGDDRRYTTRAKIALLSQMLSSPFFTDLRTEKQLGYVVFAAFDSLLGVPGLEFVVQSPVASPDQLNTLIFEFIEGYVESLKQMPPAAFDDHKAGLISTLLEEDKTLWDKSVRYWYELDRQAYDFDTNKRLAEAVEALTLEQMVEFYERTLLSDQRKTLLVSSLGSNHSDSTQAPATITAEPQSFRAKQTYFERRHPSGGETH